MKTLDAVMLCFRSRHHLKGSEVVICGGRPPATGPNGETDSQHQQYRVHRYDWAVLEITEIWLRISDWGLALNKAVRPSAEYSIRGFKTESDCNNVFEDFKLKPNEKILAVL